MKIEMAITKRDFTAIGEVAARLEAGAALAARNAGLVDRSMLTLYNETEDPEAVGELVRAIRDGAKGRGAARPPQGKVEDSAR